MSLNDFFGIKNSNLIHNESNQRYAYKQLGKNEKQLYNDIVEALTNYKKSIDRIPDGMNMNSISGILNYVLVDHPEIFWINGGGETEYLMDTYGHKTFQRFNFSYGLEPYSVTSMQREVEDIINTFIKSLGWGLSDYEKLMHVFRFIVDNTDYDTNAYTDILRGVNNSSVTMSTGIYGVFVYHKGVCMGYAKATQYLLFKLGLFCTYVSGVACNSENSRQSHAWNLVCLDGDYYYLDTTWGDPVNSNGSRNKISYAYFCVTTEELLLTHTPNNELTLPKCKASKYNYFVYNGLYLRSCDMDKITSIISNALQNGQDTAEMRFTNKKDYMFAVDKLFSQGEIFVILKKLKTKSQRDLAENSISSSKNEDKMIVSIYFKYN